MITNLSFVAGKDLKKIKKKHRKIKGSKSEECQYQCLSLEGY
jgi:hypothetical protein